MRTRTKRIKDKHWPRAARHVVCPLYDSDIWLCFDVETYRRCTEYMGVDGGGDRVSGKVQQALNENTGANVFLIGVFDDCLSTLVHECGHMAFWILEEVGVKLEDGEANEAYCYLLHTLFELCLHHMERVK